MLEIIRKDSATPVPSHGGPALGVHWQLTLNGVVIAAEFARYPWGTQPKEIPTNLTELRDKIAGAMFPIVGWRWKHKNDTVWQYVDGHEKPHLGLPKAYTEGVELRPVHDAAPWDAASLTAPGAASRKPVLLPMDTAPKDRPILVLHDHAADPYVADHEKGSLTLYGAHCEGLRVTPGRSYQIAVWGGGFDDSSHEYAGAHLPDWWFVNDEDLEQPLFPIGWVDLDLELKA